MWKFSMCRGNATLIAVYRHISFDIFYSVWGIVYLHIGYSTAFSQINERLHTFFIYNTS